MTGEEATALGYEVKRVREPLVVLLLKGKLVKEWWACDCNAPYFGYDNETPSIDQPTVLAFIEQNESLDKERI